MGSQASLFGLKRRDLMQIARLSTFAILCINRKQAFDGRSVIEW